MILFILIVFVYKCHLNALEYTQWPSQCYIPYSLFAQISNLKYLLFLAGAQNHINLCVINNFSKHFIFKFLLKRSCGLERLRLIDFIYSAKLLLNRGAPKSYGSIEWRSKKFATFGKMV